MTTGRTIAPALALAIVLLMASTALGRTVYVKSRFAKLYDGTGFKAKPIAMLKTNTELEVISQKKKLLQVKLKDGRQGWVPQNWVNSTKKSKSSWLSSVGKAARGSDGKDVSYTAGARGLSAEAESFATNRPGAKEAAAHVKRMESIKVSNAALAAFLDAGGLGDRRFFAGPADATVQGGGAK